jgi:hypothetical protein
MSAPTLDRGLIAAQLVRDMRLDGSTAPAPVPDALRVPAPAGERLPLPAPLADRVALEPALAGRLSVRFYDPRALGLAEAATLLHAAAGADVAGLGAGEEAAAVPLELFLAAWRVDGLATAVHHYDADAHALVTVGPLPSGERGEDVVLQREFADAPALLLVGGNLAAATHRHGSHGHRLLLTRAGAAAHAAWLAALALELTGSVFAGLLPTAFCELTGGDGYLRAPLFAFAAGHRRVEDPRTVPGRR